MEPIILPRISDQKPLVSIVSITYNHEPYIRDCLEGFMMQKTDFPFEVLIHDDASTDRTTDIIREYYEKRPDIFHVIIQQKNIHSQGIPIWPTLFKLSQGKYIALCEGDDYWTDQFKLQKQFDFMERNIDFFLFTHNNNILDEDFKTYTSPLGKRKWDSNNTEEAILRILSANVPFFTLSTFFRKSVISKSSEIKNQLINAPMGDTQLFLSCALLGKIHFSEEIMGTYRVHTGSAIHRKDYRDNIRVANKAYRCRQILAIKNGYGYLLKDIRQPDCINRKKCSYYFNKYKVNIIHFINFGTINYYRRFLYKYHKKLTFRPFHLTTMESFLK